MSIVDSVEFKGFFRRLVVLVRSGREGWGGYFGVFLKRKF